MRDIKIIINDDGYASSYEKFIGIQNENEATRLVFDLPDIYKKDGSYQYVAFTLPDGTIKVRRLVDYACIIDSEITSQRGVILISVIIKSVENVLDIETGYIMSSQPISGYIKKTILEETGTNSIDKNVRVYLDEFDALLMEIRSTDARLASLLDSDPSRYAEVIDARGGYTVLKNRLDAMLSNINNNSNNIKYNSREIESNRKEIVSNYSALLTKINAVASGSPLVASSTSEMTDTTRTYVNTSDGNWYYHDGSGWKTGGIYQSTVIDENDPTIISIKKGLNDINNGIETFLLKAKFERGWLLNGNYKDTSTSKVASVNTIIIDRKLELHIADGFKAGFHVFENGVFKYDSGWKTGTFYIGSNSSNSEFKMVVCRVNEDASELANITDFVEKVTFSSKINDRFNVIEKDVDDLKKEKSSISGLPNIYHTKYKTLFNGYRPTAGTTIVGNEMWVFQSSKDDFSTYADIKRYSLEDFSEITNGNITHNLGHANTVDYCEETDCLIVGNASLGKETPRFDIITNVSSLMDGENHKISYGDSNVISYDCSLFGSHYLSCCFGGDKRTAFIVMGGEEGTLENPRGFKIQLGMGTVDISNWGTKGGGTFISGKSINEYNGTFYVVGECVSDTYLGAFQGMCFHNGNLYVASGGNIARIYELQMTTSGKMYVKNSYQIDMYYTSNARVNLEPEGLCVYKGMYFIMYVGGMDNQYDSQTLLIPIENKQCGKGNIGERVTLDFKCTHIPNIHITPTSNVTDIYISQVDKEGFIVSSSSNRNGTFNWDCDIY